MGHVSFLESYDRPQRQAQTDSTFRLWSQISASYRPAAPIVLSQAMGILSCCGFQWLDLLRCCTDGVCLRSHVSRHSSIAVSIAIERYLGPR